MTLAMFLAVAYLSGGGTHASAASPSQRTIHKVPPPPDYFPLKKGDWWQYRSTNVSGETTGSTMRVVDIEKQPDQSIRYVLEVVGEGPYAQPIRDWYSKPKGWVITHKQLYVKTNQEAPFVPEKRYLKNPLRKGETWNWSGTGTAMSVNISTENLVAGEELVDVPAGKFHAMKVITHVTQAGSVLTQNYWYAPNVGLVQSTWQGDTTASLAPTVLLDWGPRPDHLVPTSLDRAIK